MTQQQRIIAWYATLVKLHLRIGARISFKNVQLKIVKKKVCKYTSNILSFSTRILWLISYVTHKQIRVLDPRSRTNYFFDGVFSPEATNQEVRNNYTDNLCLRQSFVAVCLVGLFLRVVSLKLSVFALGSLDPCAESCAKLARNFLNSQLSATLILVLPRLNCCINVNSK